jgi:hypothetical protein
MVACGLLLNITVTGVALLIRYGKCAAVVLFADLDTACVNR